MPIKFPWNFIAILIGFAIIYFIVGEIFKRIERKQKDIHTQFMRKVTHAVLVVVCAALIGGQFTTTKDVAKYLVAGSSLFIAIAGFAAQQTLADVIAGFMLSWSKPYNLNERITLVNSNITGIVEGITMRHTIIRLFDNNRLIIPNSVINKEVIKNSNFVDSKIGNFLEVEISYESDVELAMEIVKEILRENELVVDKDDITVLIRDFTPNGVALKTTVWTTDVNTNFRTCSNIRQEILKRFKAQGIVISYPHVIVLDGHSGAVKKTE